MPRGSIAHEGMPKWDRSNPIIPFIDNVMQPDVYKWSQNVEWRAVTPVFKSAMEIVGYDKTGNGYAVKVRAKDGVTYRISETDLFKIIEVSSVIKDQIPEHEYKFGKQGMTYICKVVL